MRPPVQRIAAVSCSGARPYLAVLCTPARVRGVRTPSSPSSAAFHSDFRVQQLFSHSRSLLITPCLRCRLLQAQPATTATNLQTPHLQPSVCSASARVCRSASSPPPATWPRRTVPSPSRSPVSSHQFVYFASLFSGRNTARMKGTLSGYSMAWVLPFLLFLFCEFLSSGSLFR